MSQRERNDAIFEAALTPVASPSLSSGLADAIHDGIMATPQVKAPSRWSIVGWGFRVPGPIAVAALLLLLALVGLIAVLSSRPTPDPFGVWMYRGGPERNGVMPGPGPVGDPVVVWEISLKGPVAVMPAVVAGTVYLADDSGTVQALDAATGSSRWTSELGGPVNGSPAVADGRIYVGTKAGQVIALDAATGAVAWTFLTAGPVRAGPAIVGDILYGGSDDGSVFALDSATGKQRWATSLGAPVTRGPAVADGVVYAGASGGRFAALDVTTGDIHWTRDDLGPGEVATPMVADGLVFVATGLLEVGPSDRITALDIRDGSTRWSFANPDGQPVYNGAVADGAVYVGSGNGNVYRLDEQTGGVAKGWPFSTGGSVGYLSGLVDGILYVPSDDRFIHAVDVNTGKEVWRIQVQGAPYAPAIADGLIFVGTNLGMFIAIGGTQATASGHP